MGRGVRAMRAPAPGRAPGDWSCDAFTQAQLTDVMGRVYFSQGAYSDNSFGCWSTDFLWAFCVFYAAYMMKARSRFKSQGGLRICGTPPYEHTRWMLTWGLIWLGFSCSFAGWCHVHFTNTKAHKHDAVWTLAICCLGLHCSFYLMACTAMVQLGDYAYANILAYGLALLSGVVFVGLTFALDMTFPVAFAVGSVIPLTVVGITILWHALRYEAYTDTIFTLVGSALNFAAISISFGFGGVCGNSCPSDCPMPIPHFNHNAVFHFIAIIALFFTMRGLPGISWQLEDPDGMPYFDLRGRGHMRLVREVQSGVQCGTPSHMDSYTTT